MVVKTKPKIPNGARLIIHSTIFEVMSARVCRRSLLCSLALSHGNSKHSGPRKDPNVVGLLQGVDRVVDDLEQGLLITSPIPFGEGSFSGLSSQGNGDGEDVIDQNSDEGSCKGS